MSLNDLPIEILVRIFNELPLKLLIHMESVCSYFKIIIRSFGWSQLTIRLYDRELIEFVTKIYKFSNYDLSGCNILSDSILKNLQHCTNLNLFGCFGVTDKNIKYLSNCHKLHLYGVEVTDEGLKCLKECLEVNIYGASEITYQGVLNLENYSKFRFYNCKQINI